MISSIGIVEDAKALEYEANEVEEQGRHLDSVRLMERALLLRLHVSPVDEAEACRAAERLVVKCNATAVGCFKEDQYGIAMDLLQNAMRMTDEGADPLCRNPAKRRALRGTTLNNLACLERRRGRLPAALEFIESSIATASSQSPATFLNLSAILAQMGNASQSVNAARQAILLLESGSPERHSLIAIAYHNLATALEPVDIAEAISSFETALRLSLQTLGRDSATTHSIEQNLKRLRRRPGEIGGGGSSAKGDGRANKQVVSSLPPISGLRGGAPGSSRVSDPSRPPLQQAGMKKEGGGVLSSLSSIPTMNSPRLAKLSTGANTSSSSKLKGASLHRPTPPTTLASSSAAAGGSKGSLRNRSVSQATTAAGGDGSNNSRRQSSFGGPRPPQPSSRRISTASGNNLPARPRVGQSVFSAADMAKGEDVLTYMCSRLDALLEEEREFDIQFAAATRIQCMGRVFRACVRTQERRKARQQRVSLQSSKEVTSARILQRFLGRLVELRHEKDHRTQAKVLRKQREGSSAMVIQRQARIWLARNEAKRRRNYEKNHSKAVRVLQCWFRQTLAIKTVTRMRRVHKKLTATALLSERRENAATNIQRMWRTLLSSQVTVAARGERFAANEREVLSRRATMAVTLQRCWRGFLDRRVADRRRVQRVFRLARLRHAQQELAATITLQGLARGIIARNAIRPILDDRRRDAEEGFVSTRNWAATTIQKTIRRALAKMWANRLYAAKQRLVCRERYTYVASLCQRMGRAYQGRRDIGSLHFQTRHSELFVLCADEASARRAVGVQERDDRCGARVRAAFTTLKQELAVFTAQCLRADSDRLMSEARRRQEEAGAAARAAMDAAKKQKEDAEAQEEADRADKIRWEEERQSERKAAYTKAAVDVAVEVLGSIADRYNATKEEWFYECMEAVKQLPVPEPEETMTAEEEANAERLVAKYLHNVQPREPRFKDEAVPAAGAPLSEFSQKLATAAAAQKVMDAKQKNAAAIQIQRIVRGISYRQHFRVLLGFRDEYLEARVDSERTPEDVAAAPVLLSTMVPAPPPPRDHQSKIQHLRRGCSTIPDNVGTTLPLAGSYSELERVMGSVVGYDTARSNKATRASRALEAVVLAKVSEYHVRDTHQARVSTASENLRGMVKIVEAKRIRLEKHKEAMAYRARIAAEQREAVLVASVMAQCSTREVRRRALCRIEGGIRIVKAKKALAVMRADAHANRKALQVLEDEVYAAQNVAASTIQRNLTQVSAAKKQVASLRSVAAQYRHTTVDPDASGNLEADMAAGVIQRSYRMSLARQQATSIRTNNAHPTTTAHNDGHDDSTASQQLETDAAACVIQRAHRASLARRGAASRRADHAHRRSRIQEQDAAEDAAARTLQGANKILTAKIQKQHLKAETAQKWEERRRLAADEEEDQFNAAAGDYVTLVAAEGAGGEDEDYEYEL